MRLERYGAIDIGSNAIRCQISNVLLVSGEEPEISKAHSVRTPIRLGEDAFTLDYITEERIEMMVHAFKAFYHLFKIYGVRKHMVCATSAMREAKNGAEIVQRISDETGFNIQIIEGKEEAEIIYSSQLQQVLAPDQNYLYMDVGGGSTELTLFQSGEMKASKSFKLGTIRILNELDDEQEWHDMFAWIKTNTKGVKNIKIIGSGGNIKSLYKLAPYSSENCMQLQDLEDIFEELDNLTYDQRIARFELNPDRADVIIPAAQLFIEVMHAAKSKEILIQKVGLNEGIIHHLVRSNKVKQHIFSANKGL